MSPNEPEEDGFMVGVYLCPEHAAEAQKDRSTFHYLAQRFGVPVRTVSSKFTVPMQLKMTGNFLKEKLNFGIVKVTSTTLTALRPSGFKIVMRIEDDRSYAYMFFTKDGKQVARIDTADHHDVPYGPDHLHRSPGRDNRDVEPSFTLGIPSADAPMIVRLVEQYDK